MFALIAKKHTKLPARRVTRADEVMPDAAPAAAEEAAPAVSVTTVAPSRRRFRGVVVRQVTQYAVVEYDADEGIDPYALAEGVVAAVPPDAWQDRGEPWAYLESSEPIDAAAAEPAANENEPAADEPKSRRRKSDHPLAAFLDSAEQEVTALVAEIDEHVSAAKPLVQGLVDYSASFQQEAADAMGRDGPDPDDATLARYEEMNQQISDTASLYAVILEI